MALGWNDVQRMKRVEAQANELGFMFATGRLSFDSNYSDGGLLVLKPLGDALPHYSRDAEIKYGTLEQIETWLGGLVWAREYDSMLNLSNNKGREKKEQQERNRQLMLTIKIGKTIEGELV